MLAGKGALPAWLLGCIAWRSSAGSLSLPSDTDCPLPSRTPLSVHRREGLNGAIDFEVTDALDKLEKMSILEHCEGEESRLFKVLPLDQAVEQAHVRHFDESRWAHGRSAGVWPMGREAV